MAQELFLRRAEIRDSTKIARLIDDATSALFSVQNVVAIV